MLPTANGYTNVYPRNGIRPARAKKSLIFIKKCMRFSDSLGYMRVLLCLSGERTAISLNSHQTAMQVGIIMPVLLGGAVTASVACDVLRPAQ